MFHDQDLARLSATTIEQCLIPNLHHIIASLEHGNDGCRTQTQHNVYMYLISKHR